MIIQSDLSWDEYLYGFASHASKKSKDSTQVGAALISQNNAVLICGFNGPPMGVRDWPERFDRPAKYLFASHAEANVINFAARHGIKTEGCRLFTTHCCCSGCMKSIIQAGIVEVVFGPGTTSMPPEEMDAAREMAADAQICYRPVKI